MMNWKFINDVDELTFQLECAIDNLNSVHTVMESDGGVNWKNHCNALFSTFLLIHNIHAELARCVDRAVADSRKSKEIG